MTLVEQIDVEALRDLDEATARSRRPADVDPDQYEQWPDDAPLEHQCVTSGVTSHVHDADREQLGHVVMLDYDDVDPATAIEGARELEAPAVVLRSSTASYHVVELAIRPWEDAVEIARASECSQEYVEEMVDRGRFVLRTQPKWRKTGELYKPEPEPIGVGDGAGGVAPLSKPHMVRLRQLAQDTGADEVARAIARLEDGRHVEGATFHQTNFETLTDELREVVDHG